MCFSKPGLAVSSEETPGNLPEYPHGLLGPFSLFSVSLHKDHRRQMHKETKGGEVNSEGRCGGRAGCAEGASSSKPGQTKLCHFLNKA